METNDETKTKIMEELRHALHQAMSLPGTKLADSGYMLDYQLYMQQDESLKFFVLPDEYLTGKAWDANIVHMDATIGQGIPVRDSLTDADIYAAAYGDSLHVAPAPWLDDILGDASRYRAGDMQKAANAAYAAAHHDVRLEEIELQQEIAGYIPGFAPVVPAVEWIAPMITGLAINMFIRDFQYSVISAAMDADRSFMEQLYGLSIMSDSGGKGISESDDRLRIAFLAPWEREYCGVTWKSTKGWHPRYQDGETLHQAGARHFRTVYSRTERGTRL